MNQAVDSINVREAVINDKEFIIDANIAMAKEIEDLDLDRDTLGKGVEAVFKDPARGKYVVAELNGKVCASLLITIEWSDWRNLEIAWIQSLYVLREHRGKGAFKKMFSYIEKQVEQGIYAGIRLYVDITNERAREVYSKLGMNDEHYMMFEKMR